MAIQFKSLSEINNAAKQFLELTKDKKKFAFYGKMGVGKTTFIKQICKELGVDENDVNSPSFTIINEYSLTKDIIYHIDFYRLKELKEVYDIGAEDIFYSPHYCFIEWPEIVKDILPDDFVKIEINESTEGVRVIKII